MLFNSIDYLFFFPLVLLIYFVLPKKIRYLWLLAASYYFYACWNAKYALLMLFSTAVTYASGLLIAASHKRGKAGQKKLWVALSFLINLGILAVFKYGGFFAENVNALLASLGLSGRIGAPDVLLPVGISFYTFQALSYTMDTYRGQIDAERNFFVYALYVSFFPQLVAGPIERSAKLLPQIKQPRTFKVENARRGLLLIAWGLLMKVVIADNIAPIVTRIYGDYASYAGSEIALATVLFAFQIYCDFAGYSAIAIGSAKVLDVDLMRNFNQPYLACTIRDFWRRWHLSLTTWFTDYLYIPLGGNRRGKARKALNVMIVFLVSGLWHGANWTFVVWGAANGLLMLVDEATQGLREKLRAALKIPAGARWVQWLGRLATFCAVCCLWVFFRAQTLSEAFAIFGRIFGAFNASALAPMVAGLGLQTELLLLFSLIVLLAVDTAQYHGHDVAAQLQSCVFPVRWAVYLALVFVIMYFGAYGATYAATQFIYFQF